MPEIRDRKPGTRSLEDHWRRLLCHLGHHRNVIREVSIGGGNPGPKNRLVTIMRWGPPDTDDRGRIVDVKLQCRDCGIGRTNFYSRGRWRG